MHSPDDRVAELISAALAGELTDAEATELDRLRRERPEIDDELRDLRALSARLRHGDLAWTTPRDLDALRTRVVSAVPSTDAGAPALPASAAPPVPRRRRWITPALVAASLVIGVGIGLSVPALTSQPTAGPPGTLGAVEAIDVHEDRTGVVVDADLVAHTWGTEALLEATGLDVGATYAVVFVGADGREFSAGEILGSEIPIVCRMNAGVMRGDTVRLEVRDAAQTVVAHADLPPA